MITNSAGAHAMRPSRCPHAKELKGQKTIPNQKHILTDTLRSQYEYQSYQSQHTCQRSHEMM